MDIDDLYEIYRKTLEAIVSTGLAEVQRGMDSVQFITGVTCAELALYKGLEAVAGSAVILYDEEEFQGKSLEIRTEIVTELSSRYDINLLALKLLYTFFVARESERDAAIKMFDEMFGISSDTTMKDLENDVVGGIVGDYLAKQFGSLNPEEVGILTLDTKNLSEDDKVFLAALEIPIPEDEAE